MSTVTIRDAETTLPELIHGLSPGEAVVITEDGVPVARLVVPGQESAVERLHDVMISLAVYDEEPVPEFEEYLNRLLDSQKKDWPKHQTQVR